MAHLTWYKKIGLQVVLRSSSGYLQVLQVLCEANLYKLYVLEGAKDNSYKSAYVKNSEAPDDNYSKTYLLSMLPSPSGC